MWLSSKECACQEETQVQLLGQENPLKKEMATHSGILAQEIPWTEELGRLQSMGSQRVRHDLATKEQHIHVLEYYQQLTGMKVKREFSDFSADFKTLCFHC